MITHKRKCPMCGDEYIVNDIKNVQPTCGKRMCVTNWEYRLKHMDPITGDYPNPEEINKWRG
jgi:hypothetical protein